MKLKGMNNMDDNDEKYKLLNTKEVARLLFGSEEESNTKKVRRLARNGTIKHFRNGKKEERPIHL